MDNNCTLFPEGNWSDCCKLHDRRYENKRLTKRQADILLYRCVKRKRKGRRLVAIVMYVGVRSPIGLYFYCRANVKGFR